MLLRSRFAFLTAFILIKLGERLVIAKNFVIFLYVAYLEFLLKAFLLQLFNEDLILYPVGVSTKHIKFNLIKLHNN